MNDQDIAVFFWLGVFGLLWLGFAIRNVAGALRSIAVAVDKAATQLELARKAGEKRRG